MSRRILFCLVTATALVAPATAAVAAPDTRGPVLQQQLEAVHDAGMPGAFAEVRDGRRTWTPAAGVSDVATGEKVRAGLRHRVGSISKTFVAATVVGLAGERKLALDAPARRYLPGLDVPAEVTVRMLLNHTSGIGNYTSALLADADGLITTGETTYRPKELARIGLALPPTHKPGTAYAYSNTNYVLAALIVEKVTGHSHRTEITRRILKPLKLRDTYFEGSDPLIRGPHMHAYVPWTDGELRDFTAYNMSWAFGAGEMVSTAADLNTFYRALLTGRVLTARQLTEMQRTVPFLPDAPEAGGYGLGLYWVQSPCGKAWGHDGGVVGHQTVSWHSADGRRQVSYAQNMAFYQTSPTEPHPIDAASSQFLVTALCGDAAPATLRSAPLPGPVITDGRGPATS